MSSSSSTSPASILASCFFPSSSNFFLSSPSHSSYLPLSCDGDGRGDGEGRGDGDGDGDGELPPPEQVAQQFLFIYETKRVVQ